ncbi:MAG: TRAP transporter large permease [Lachnospiraceae bacterium]|nr:TRAP transporter large permease [Lachnospiraceae bacterium]
MNPGLLVFILLFGLSILGLPIYLAIAIATMIGLASGGFPMLVVVQKTIAGLNSSALLSIPLFILAGNVMSFGISKKLLDTANVLMGRVRGGLSAVTVVASALFGAISGSAVATCSAIGGMTIPAMEDSGYDKEFASATAICSSVLGPIVPPSIVLIVYASLTDTSVQKLFIATISSAVLMTVAFLVYCLYYGKKHNLPKQEKASGKQVATTLKSSIWALLMPILVLGTIFAGICTVTEAASISVVYAVIVNMFVYKTMTFQQLKKSLYNSAVSVAAIMILIAISKASSYVVIAGRLPQLFMEFMTTLTSSKFLTLIIINIILLFLGCLMDSTAILVMMVPLMLNLIKAMGMNLLQFGMICSVNINLGVITPPVGVSILVGSKIGKVSITGAFKRCIPFFLLGLVDLLLVTYWPQFTLLLPSLLK